MTGNSKNNLLILAILSLFIAFGAAHAFRVPLWMPYDEPFHFEYIDVLVKENRLPKMEETYEAYQPPLYYAALALMYPRGLKYAQVGRALRIFTLLFAAIGVVAVFGAMKVAAGEGNTGEALFATFAVTMIPQFLCVSGSINNDTFAILFAALAFYGMFRGMREGGLKWEILAAAAAGAALWSKPLNLYLVPLLPLYAWLRHGRPRDAFPRAVLLLGIALLVGGWWYLRNIYVYGDFSGSGYVIKTVYSETGRLALTPKALTRWLGDLFAQFWTFNNYLRNLLPRFPRTFYAIYLLFSVIVAAGAAKAGIGMSRMPAVDRRLFLLSAAAIGLVLAEIFYNSTRVYSPSGRYLFVAFVPIAHMIVVAHRQLIPPRFTVAYRLAWGIVFPLLNVYMLIYFFRGINSMPFAPPFS